ncbi:MAG: hypothetical protein HN742_20935 [Lentisphaerae bacterium]|nr:hypothetical protein [Lentisphaerota bacterium]MBT4823218.1 hypothetical protein [Lentisphaerota bacterium]MBT5610728.1 hypothetical protein [Lentisphaerota bacterium]MBT7054297.1 hypothetical protein [Lentisphaerota bacterium]MBT7844358.1 hypothetical protein [Lentisphaerota bacterium]
MIPPLRVGVSAILGALFHPIAPIDDILPSQTPDQGTGMAKAKTAEVSEKKLSKRKRKRGARTPQTKTKTKTKAAASQAAPDDTMSQCVALCQKQAWREAMLLCLKMGAKARREGKKDLASTLKNASHKIEFSLRRQMAATLLADSAELLKREYLLDVG